MKFDVAYYIFENLHIKHVSHQILYKIKNTAQLRYSVYLKSNCMRDDCYCLVMLAAPSAKRLIILNYVVK